MIATIKPQTNFQNSFFSLLGYIIPIIFSIAITPFLLRALGIPLYGLFILINTINLFVGLLDLGFSSALIKYLSQSLASNEIEKISKIIAVSRWWFLLVGILGWLFFIIAGWPTTLFLEEMKNVNIIYCFVLAGFSFFLTCLIIPFQLAPRARLRYDWGVKLELGQLTLFNLGILIMSWDQNIKLIEVLWWQIISLIIFYPLYLTIFKKIIGHITIKPKFEKNTFTQLFNFGFKTFLANTASLSLNYFDRLLIPLFLGPTTLTYYGLPGNITVHTAGIANSLTTILFPLSSQHNKNEISEKLKNTHLLIFRLTAILSTGITLAIFIFREKILWFWLGGDFYIKSSVVMAILALVGFILALSKSSNSILLGLAENKFLARLSIIMALINLILLLILIPLWGILGASFAFLIAVIPGLYSVYFLENKIMGLEGFYKRYSLLLLKLIISGGLFYSLSILLLLPQIKTIWHLIIIGPTSILIYLIIFAILGFFEKEDKNHLTKIRQLWGGGNLD